MTGVEATHANTSAKGISNEQKGGGHLTRQEGSSDTRTIFWIQTRALSLTEEFEQGTRGIHTSPALVKTDATHHCLGTDSASWGQSIPKAVNTHFSSLDIIALD